MQISIAFNPATDSAESIAQMVARIFGGNPTASVAIHPDDNPTAGEEPGTAAATTGTDGKPTVDSTGLPWDARIHSTPATLTAKNVWRAKRGVDPLTVAAVEKELRGAGAPATPPTPASAPATPSLPTPPAPGALPGLPTPPAPKEPTPYESFVAWIGDHVAKGTMGVTAEWVQQVLEGYGVAEGKVVNLQNAAPDLIATIRTAIAGALQVPAI